MVSYCCRWIEGAGNLLACADKVNTDIAGIYK